MIALVSKNTSYGYRKALILHKKNIHFEEKNTNGQLGFFFCLLLQVNFNKINNIDTFFNKYNVNESSRIIIIPSIIRV